MPPKSRMELCSMNIMLQMRCAIKWDVSIYGKVHNIKKLHFNPIGFSRMFVFFSLHFAMTTRKATSSVELLFLLIHSYAANVMWNGRRHVILWMYFSRSWIIFCYCCSLATSNIRKIKPWTLEYIWICGDFHVEFRCRCYCRMVWYGHTNAYTRIKFTASFESIR